VKVDGLFNSSLHIKARAVRAARKIKRPSDKDDCTLAGGSGNCQCYYGNV